MQYDTSFANGPDNPAIDGIIGLRNVVSPATHNEAAITRFSTAAREIRHDGERQILV
jgi:hypothetical protein